MKKLRFILLSLVVLLTSGHAAAYDFESGGLYYNILDADAKTVEVTSDIEINDWQTRSSYTGDFVIPATVANGGITYNVIRVGKYAFSHSEITSLTIREGVESIEDCAFLQCYSMKEFSLPSSIRTLGTSSFFSCSQLPEIVLPEGLNVIGNQAFYDCSGAKIVVLPSTLTKIEGWAFMYCTGLNKVISHIMTPFEIDQSSFAISSTWNEQTQTNSFSKSSATLYVPAGTKSAYQALQGWNMLSAIYEGEPQEVTLSDGLRYSYVSGEQIASVIGYDDSYDSQDVVIQSTVEINGSNYFVKSVGSNAFRNNGRIQTLTINDGVETIGSYAFGWCYNLRTVYLPSSINTINSWAFQSCEQLTSLSIPEGVKEIGERAFQSCYHLSKAVLPSTLTKIGRGVFNNSNSLYAVVSHIQSPFEIDTYVFGSEQWSEQDQKSYYTPSSATLYVPVGTKSNYEAFEGWKMFANIVEGELNEETIDGITYSYNSSTQTATVIGSTFVDHCMVTIPSYVPINGGNYEVKTISASAFYNNEYVDSLYISSGIETIENNAFQECYNMRFVELPSSLKAIGERSFGGCGIRILDIPEGVTTIGPYAFQGCGLQKVTLPSTISSIGRWAFIDLYNLTTVVSRIAEPVALEEGTFAKYGNWNSDEQKYYFIKNDATLYIPIGTTAKYQAAAGWDMFADIVEGEIKEITYNGLIYSYVEGKGTATVTGRADSELQNVTIPGTIPIGDVNYAVKAIGARAFYDLPLQSVTIEDGVETIGNQAFYDSDGIYDLVLPSTLKSIGDEAFTYSYFTSLVLPEGLVSIGRRAFADCRRIQKLELPSTLDSIADYAFFYCSSLTSVISRIQTPFEISKSVFSTGEYWNDGIQTFTESPATLYVPVGTKSAYEAFAGWKMFAGGIYEGEPKEGSSGIFNYIYMEGSKVATLVAGDYSSLRNLEVPATADIAGNTYNVVGIGTGAFQNYSLLSVTIPEGVETIGNNAFSNCHSMRSIKLPESIIQIGNNAFSDCSSLDTIAIPRKVESIGNYAFAWTGIKEIVIPATTKSIGNSVFEDCRQITSISVDAGNAYYDSRNNCNALIETATNKLLKGSPSTVIPNSVVEIEHGAFSGYSSMTSINIPNSVTTIRSAAFNDCDGLTSIYIPSSVTVINPNPFTNCDALASIKVDANNTEYDSRNNCDAIIEKKTNTLVSGCKNTVIPHGIKIIGSSAFNCVSGLDSLKIPYGVEEIQDHAISYSSVRFVEIPNSVKTIGWYAFGGNYNLTTLVSKIKDPSSVYLDYGAFYDSSIQSSAILYVPMGKKSDYEQATNNWSNFSNIVEMDGDPVASPMLSYDGRAITATSTEKDVDMYYSTDDFKTSNYYDGPIAVSDLGTVKVIAEKTFCADSEPASIEVKYLYDGDTLKLAEAGLMADAIRWCGNDSVVKMTVVGPINATEFETIRTLKNLKFLNLAGATGEKLSIPDNAFANTNIVSFVAPSTLSGVGSGIFSGCQQLAAVNWATDQALPADALNDVANPNLLLYLKEGSTAPTGINNVIIGGTTKKITLVDATGNNNFYCPVEFHADSVVYTRNFQQKTEVGVSRGWETIVLPFAVNTIKHETKGTLTPFASYWGYDYQRPFWLYTLEQNNISSASQIEANVPYLICMPNADEYGDQYNLAGNVSFIGTNVNMAVSVPQEKSQYDITFVPAYQSVPTSADVFALNVNQEYKGYPAGSLFVNNFREVRPFEAYSVHPSAAEKVSASRMFTVGSLIGGDEDTTGIIDVMLKKNNGTNSDAVVRVYSLSGALVKQGKAEDVTKGLPKGIYIANGKKFVVR